MNIIWEDKHLLLVHKEAGEATQTKRLGEPDIVSKAKVHIQNPYVAVINRLDQPVEGIVLLAKTKDAAAKLSKQLQDNKIQKFYYALISGRLDEPEGTLEHYIKKNGKTNLSQVVSEKDPEGKKAILHYRVKESFEDKQLVDIHLITGRHHQIRVQFSATGHPLLGDRKYGRDESGLRQVALCAYKLEFVHPVTGKQISYQITPNQKNLRELLGEENS